jgi:hypothetical protein
MKKNSSSAKARVREIEPFNKRRVNLGGFKSDLTPQDWERLRRPTRGPIVFPPPFFHTIDTLTPAKIAGKGRTNTTLFAPTIVQTDANTPSANFDSAVTGKVPIIQINFEPGAYGITSVADYAITFSIEVFGSGTFEVKGFAGFGTVVNARATTLSNRTSATLLFQKVGPRDQTLAILQQDSGPPWRWFSTRISFPPIVLQPA